MITKSGICHHDKDKHIVKCEKRQKHNVLKPILTQRMVLIFQFLAVKIFVAALSVFLVIPFFFFSWSWRLNII